MTPTEQQALAYADTDLDRDEGTIPYAYQDSLGYWTIGRGIMIDRRKGGRLLPEEMSFIDANRLKLLLTGVQKEPWYSAVRGDAVRLAAILNMQFQLGAGSDEVFANAFACIAKGDWRGAAANLRQSKWAKQQTPARASRVITAIETGKRP
jgi:lysozyme